MQSARYQRLSLKGLPVFFANSFPKSGTHLLTQVIQGFPNIGPAVDSGLEAVVTYEGRSGRLRSSEEILHDLQRLLPGDIAYGHLQAWAEIVEWLCRPGFAAYFILRDPRDVVVSHVHYITEMAPDHIHHRYYTEELKTFDERLGVSILGLSNDFPDIAKRFAPFLGWLERPEVLTLRYEDLIIDRYAAIGQVLDHAMQRGFTPVCERDTAIHKLAASIDPARSPTFRSGKIGGWRDGFSEDNKRLFKAVAGDLLLKLGYERDADW